MKNDMWLATTSTASGREILPDISFADKVLLQLGIMKISRDGVVGYHNCLTHSRSSVRTRVATSFLH
jgi:hypothetical protein